jgi:hypothetical protein
MFNACLWNKDMDPNCFLNGKNSTIPGADHIYPTFFHLLASGYNWLSCTTSFSAEFLEEKLFSKTQFVLS